MTYVPKSLFYLESELLDEGLLADEGRESVDPGLDAGLDLAAPAVGLFALWGSLRGESFWQVEDLLARVRGGIASCPCTLQDPPPSHLSIIEFLKPLNEI